MFDLYQKLLTRKILFGTTVGVALFFMTIGVIFWGGFNTAMEVTNTNNFCISCHEMEDNVYQEYKQTIHYNNRSGVRASCSDCHVPDPWVHKVVRKIEASNEVFHKILGSINTPEKFDEKRFKMAQKVWKSMKKTDSRECRNCHDFNTMDPEAQKSRASKQHLNAMKVGSTCIDCHKGIVHKKVHDQLTDEDLETLEKPDPSIIRPIASQWIAFEENIKKRKSTPQTIAKTSAVKSAPITGTEKNQLASANTSGSGFNWDAVAGRIVTVFYPGQASMEWMLGREHGGKRAFNSGDRCVDCHEDELVEIGEKIVSGEKEMKVGKKRGRMEPNVIPGKRGSFPVTVQAAYDNNKLYMRFQWKDSTHTPAPFIEGGKMDPANKIKLAIILATDEVEYADRAGCWGSCHADLLTMPYAPEQEAINDSSLKYATNGVSKYIAESRSSINLKSRKGALGGWDKLKGADEIATELEAGHFMDLIRYKAGKNIAENSYILTERVTHDGIDIIATGTLNSGLWTVDISRPLNADKSGDISLDTALTYNIGFAIHDDYTSARYHHVSLGYKLGFDNSTVEINAKKISD
jgi:nitrate/TMAO reductase-like tetraheme cytochrome c subunit